MRRTLTALAAAATIAIVAVAAPQQAEARWRGGWGGPAIIGGLAAGAILGGALAGPRYGYYGYGGDPYYGSYAYGGCGRYRVMTPYGWRWHRTCY
jgi:hypothetical protein